MSSKRSPRQSKNTVSTDVSETAAHRPVREESPPRLVIRASAGTGKTFQLSSRYLALLRRSKPERILASTFTRKAAGEILERVLLRLARAVQQDDALAELSRHTGDPPLTRTECLSLLAQFTRQLHRVSIGTLDAFFAKLAGSYALELGIPPGWGILDEVEAQGLRAQAVEMILRDGPVQDTVQLMHLLAKGQTSRSVSTLLTETVNNFYSVFQSTQEESWNRFPELTFLSSERQEELLAQIDAIPLQSQMAKARNVNIENFRQQNWEGFLKKGVMKNVLEGNPHFSRKPIPEDLVAALTELGQHARAVLLTAWKDQNRATYQILQRFHQTYSQLKDRAAGLEFEDVTRRLCESLDRYEVDPAYRLDAEIEHLLLDEFQDTSLPQWQVIRRFAERACARPDGTFFCVGDSKQAIYGWRGGEATIFETIAEHIPDLQQMPLDASFRSSQPVIDVVNRVMKGLTQHDRLDDFTDLLQAWSGEFPEHSTMRIDRPGFVRLLTGPSAEPRENGKIVKADQDTATLCFAADYVQALLTESPQATIGVLTRRNKTVGRLIYELQQRGIAASEESGNPLTDSAAVELVLSLMTLADHPGDTVARFHVATSPLGEMLGYTEYDDDRAAESFAQFLRERLVQDGYSETVHALLAPLAPRCDARELRRLQQLALLADQHDSMTPGLRTRDFVERVRSQKQSEPTAARVRVMNLHQAKGLEFDTVVLPELDGELFRYPQSVSLSPHPGRPPSLVATYRNQNLFQFLGGDFVKARHQTLSRTFQESLCLLYVALTRAVHSLHMIIAPQNTTDFTKNYAGLLRAALVAKEVVPVPEKTLYEHGDPRWFNLVSWTVSGDRPPAQSLAIRFRESASARGLTRLSPSRLKKDIDAVPERVFADSAPGYSAAASRARGSLMHRWLEELDWLEEGLPGDEELLRLSARFGRTPEEAVADLQDLKAALQQPAVRLLLSRSSLSQSEQLPFADPVSQEIVQTATEPDLRHELPFAVRDGAALMTGSLDRIVIFRRDGRPLAADVIDFKTDGLGQGETRLNEKVEKYQEQMAAYRLAVSRLFSLPEERISVRLVFLKDGRIVTL